MTPETHLISIDPATLEEIGRTPVSTPEEIASRIDAGQVWINQHNALEVELPFGGVKSSGFGREGGTEGIREFLQSRVISRKNIHI